MDLCNVKPRASVLQKKVIGISTNVYKIVLFLAVRIFSLLRMLCKHGKSEWWESSRAEELG